MAARIAEAQERAEHAESTEDFWRRSWADGRLDEQEREEMDRRLATNVRHWSSQVLELSFFTAWLTGGLPAAAKKHSRVNKLWRELRRNRTTWVRIPEEIEEEPTLVVVSVTEVG